MKDVLKVVVFGALFLVPFLTLYVENDYFFPFITGKNFGFRILVDIAFAAWVLLALYDVKYRPKISGIVWSFGALLVVMFFANLFGKHPSSSFWSNFERMDGYVSILHTFLYALVLGSVLQTKKLWQYLFNTSLAVATLVAYIGYAQFAGWENVANAFNVAVDTNRIDSTLGNAAYMAVYMLFHIFIAFWLFVESKSKWLKSLYVLLAVLFTFVLVETGTRGTAVGLAAGVVVMSGYIALFGNKYKEIRKYAIGAFVILFIAVAGFIAGRDTEFVQSSQNLSRIANISLDDLTIRGTIWSMAWEGVKEKPMLGWGQSNFNFVFNEYYEPSLYAQEQWFDRSHNIFLDWLIAGGFLGLFAYLSIFVVCVWYLFLRPIFHKDDETFTVLERAVLLGILAGYFTHNLVVFDNIVSYMFFAMILGLIHSRVSTPVKAVQEAKVDEDIVLQFATPVMIAVFALVMYFAYLPGMSAAGGVIDAFRAQDPTERLELFKEAINQDSFAQQEIIEQLTTQAISVISNPNLSNETKTAWFTYTEQQLMWLAEDKPEDARIHVFIGSFYRSIGQYEKAMEKMEIARSYSPRKQAIIQQQGFVALSMSNYELARDYFKEAFELDENSLVAREYYVGSLLHTNQLEEAEALLDSDEAYNQAAQSDFVISAANQSGNKEFMVELFERRVELNPENPQNWATLGYLYHDIGNSERAVEVLEEGAELIPEFAPTASCFSENIKAGNNPQDGC